MECRVLIPRNTNGRPVTNELAKKVINTPPVDLTFLKKQSEEAYKRMLKEGETGVHDNEADKGT